MAKRRMFGFDVHYANGFLCAFYRAYSKADVERALALEWGDEAKGMKIARAPLSICYDDELSTDRFYDLTSNEGWASIISRQEVENMR